MNKQERVNYIQQKLAQLYPEPPIPLDHRVAYTLLVAVLLSAQCTDARVNLVTPQLFALADNPTARKQVADDLMADPVDLHTNGMRAPLPLPCETAFAW